MSEADDVFRAYERKRQRALGGPVLAYSAEQNYLPGMAPAGLPLVYFRDIEACLDTLDFVEGVMVEGSAGVIYGESNSGKTFFMTDLALHVAAGIPWRDKAIDQGGVIYCVLEGGIGFQNRIAAWRMTYTASDTEVHFASIPSSINLLDPDADTERLIQAIHQAAAAFTIPVKLVVIDTLSRAMAGGNENAPDDMGALVMNMDRIRAATKSAVYFVHHSGKDQAKGARGHSLLRAAIDTEIEVVAENDDAGGQRTATIVKQRELPKGDSFAFNLKIIELGTNRRGKPVTSCIVENPGGEASADAALSRRRLPKQQQRALEVLADLVAEAGRGGFAGTPAGIPSIPEGWWRQRFYERAMPGEEQDTKKKAFGRAADALIASHLVGMSAGRVWVVSRTH